MSPVRSGLLAAWGSAWLAGRVGYDELVAEVTREDEPHRVAGLPGSDTVGPDGLGSLGGSDRGVPLLWVLSAWRDRGVRSLAVVLPVPGDPRGLPGPGAFTTAALEAGEAVLGGELGLVPRISRHGSVGSVTVLVRWQGYHGLPPVPVSEPLSVAEAQHELTTAMRDAATELAGLDAASWRPDVAENVARLRRRTAPAPLPPGHDPRAVRLLVQADRLAAVLELADADAPGGALTTHAASARSAALRPLWTAVRRARLAAYNSGG
ncbi:MAG TPA: hypothetical protein VLJ59_11350 [Mycobacteriales bacterium]|nr:hypothetical protein [Mycobacteriales bacterium]